MKIKDIIKYIFYKIIDFQPFFYRFPIKIFNYNFQIHKNDVDPWPSFPHMHSIEDNLVLNIYTGEVYRKITRDCIGEARDKDMIKLWNDTKFLNIVIEARKNKPINVKKLEDIPYNWLNEENLNWIKENEVSYKGF